MTPENVPATTGLQDRLLRLALRSVAIAIVLAGIIDPSFMRERVTKPVVALLNADEAQPGNAAIGDEARSNEASGKARDKALARLRESLADKALVVPGRTADADAQIVLGSVLPFGLTDSMPPTFILSSAGAGGARVESISLPTVVPLGTSTELKLLLATTGQEANTAQKSTTAVSAELELRESGILLDRHSAVLQTGQRTSAVLRYTPSSPGVHQLELAVVNGGDSLRFTRSILAEARVWRIHFHDVRPSWLSTFVRRSVERDPRFRVSSRVVTSTNISRHSSDAAASLAAVESMETPPDVLVIGAPEALGRGEVAQLERMLSTGGMSIVLLPDHAIPMGAPVEALWRPASSTAPRDWRLLPPLPNSVPYKVYPVSLLQALSQASAGSAGSAGSDRSSRLSGSVPSLMAAETGVLRAMPPDAEPLAFAAAAGMGANSAAAIATAFTNPVIWRLPSGRGELLVSTAFDAWKYRDRQSDGGHNAAMASGSRAGETSVEPAFELVWRNLLAAAAQRRWVPLSVSAPGGSEAGGSGSGGSGVGVSLPLALSGVLVRSSTVSHPPSVFFIADPEASRLPSGSGGNGEAATLLPTILPDFWRAVWPSRSGSHQHTPFGSSGVVQATVGRDTIRVPVLADQGEAYAPDEQLARWARSTGGRLVSPNATDSLAAFISAAVGSRHHTPPWHPMRSPWWILALAAALGGEWWLRRRQGLS